MFLHQTNKSNHESHYGRDAIVGIGLFLSLFCERNLSASNLLNTFPKYYMVKEKINLSKSANIEKIFNVIAEKYKNEKIDLVDGIRIDFSESWVQLRKSNTEPIIRIYSESKSEERSNNLISEVKTLIKVIFS